MSTTTIGRQVEQEVVEGQVGSAGDDDVRRVPDQGGGAADVGGERLRDEERDRVTVRAGRQTSRVTGAMSSTVVTLSSSADATAVMHDQQDHRRERPALGTLRGPDGEVVEDAGLLDDADDHHHAQQQEDDVPVDPGLLAEERDVGVDDTEQHHAGRAEQGGGDPVDPFGGDQDVGGDEDGDDEHRGHGVAVVGAAAGGRAGG